SNVMVRTSAGDPCTSLPLSAASFPSSVISGPHFALEGICIDASSIFGHFHSIGELLLAPAFSHASGSADRNFAEVIGLTRLWGRLSDSPEDFPQPSVCLPRGLLASQSRSWEALPDLFQ